MAEPKKGMFSFITDTFKKGPNKRQQQLDEAIRKAEGEAPKPVEPASEYETTPEGLRRKRKQAEPIQF